jgi:hypothetical protein
VIIPTDGITTGVVPLLSSVDEDRTVNPDQPFSVRSVNTPGSRSVSLRAYHLINAAGQSSNVIRVDVIYGELQFFGGTPGISHSSESFFEAGGDDRILRGQRASLDRSPNNASFDLTFIRA